MGEAVDNDKKSNEELSWSLEGQGYIYRRSTKQYHAIGSSEEAENNYSVDAAQYIVSHGQVTADRAEKYLAWLMAGGFEYTEE